MHLPCPTYCHQPHQTRRIDHHVLAHACPLRLMPQWRLRLFLAGSSTADAESCSLVLRSIGFLQRCSPPHLAVTQLRFGYHLFSWFQLCRVSHPAGLCCLTAHEHTRPRVWNETPSSHSCGIFLWILYASCLGVAENPETKAECFRRGRRKQQARAPVLPVFPLLDRPDDVS